MKYLTSLFLLALSSVVSAAPTAAAADEEITENTTTEVANFTIPENGIRPRSLERRQPGGVFITTDIHWGGTPGYAKQPWDTCIRLDAPWWKTISSVGPDSGNAVVLSEDYNCGHSDRETILYDGNDDLRTVGWNDRAGSFMVRQVAVENGRQCIRQVDPDTFPELDCRWCCTGCTRSGSSCCPPGATC